MEIIFIIIITLALWLSSIYMLSDWNKFKTFSLFNGILIVTYLGFLIYSKEIAIWGHDEYGLGLLFRSAICLFTHILIVFVFALIKRQQHKK